MSPMNQRLMRPRASGTVAVARDASGNVIQPVSYSEGGVNYTAHIFTTSGTLEFLKSTDVEYLIVGGGGGGGFNFGGGGGGGGVLSGQLAPLTASYPVTVGAGGSGGAYTNTNGGNSSAFGVTATGGGEGGEAANSGGAAGGSGGGAGSRASSGTLSGGAGVAGQGFKGGDSVYQAYTDPGQAGSSGGGGATQLGGNWSPAAGGNGGAGLTSALSGSSLVYGSGGGGSHDVVRGIGGSGAGNGGQWNVNGVFNTQLNGSAGTNGLGGGGGAGARNGGAGAAGGSGTVIVRYRTPVPAAFKPTDISGLTLWLDATQGVSLNSGDGKVEQWSDLSGNGRDFTQPTSAQRPTYTALMNGRNVISFTWSGGIQTHLLRTGNTNADYSGASGATLYMVWRVSGENTYNVAYFGGDSQGLDVFQIIKSYMSYFRPPFDRLLVDSTGAQPLPVTGVALYGTMYTASSNTHVARANGSQYAAQTNTNYTLYRNGTNVTYYVGSVDFNGDIAEIAMFNRPLTSAEVDSIESYLSKKWGTQISRPLRTIDGETLVTIPDSEEMRFIPYV